MSRFKSFYEEWLEERRAKIYGPFNLIYDQLKKYKDYLFEDKQIPAEYKPEIRKIIKDLAKHNLLHLLSNGCLLTFLKDTELDNFTILLISGALKKKDSIKEMDMEEFKKNLERIGKIK